MQFSAQDLSRFISAFRSLISTSLEMDPPKKQDREAGIKTLVAKSRPNIMRALQEEHPDMTMHEREAKLRKLCRHKFNYELSETEQWELVGAPLVQGSRL